MKFVSATVLLATASVAGLMTSTAASAQTPADAETGTADEVPPAADATGVGIIVTAQRREQTLLEVPQSISVVEGATLERQEATSFQDYAKLVPGLNVTQTTPGSTRLVLRGINTGSVASAVAVYVDDAPFGSSSGLANAGVLAGDFDTFDVARVEVLRGPQGTLYGANALSGVLKFVTRAPQFDALSVRARGGVEFTKDGGTGYQGNAVVNVPLGDSLALRGSGYYRRSAGFIDAVGRAGSNINSAESYGGRAALLFQPVSQLSVRLLGVYQNLDVGSPSSFDADPLTLQPVNATNNVRSGRRTRFERIVEENKSRYRLANGVIEYDAGPVALTSATSYSTLKRPTLGDFSNSGLQPLVNLIYAPAAPRTVSLAVTNDIKTDKFAQELRLSTSSLGPVDLILGGYYTDERSRITQRVLPFTLASQQFIDPAINGTPFGDLTEFIFVQLNSKYEEIAGFGSATVHLGDRFDVELGGRYSHNKQSSRQFINQLNMPSTIRGASSEDVFTFSIAPRFEVSDRAAVYARVAKGYRPGGPNAAPPGAPADFPFQYNADTLISYEGGFRAETANRTFGIDASAYYLDWKDIQIITVVDTSVGPFTANANGQKARSYGAEVTGTVRPTRGFSNTLSVAYNNARLRGDTAPPGGVNTIGGFDGDRLPYAPEWTATFSSDYEFSVGPTAKAFVGGNLALKSDQATAFATAYRTAFGRRLFIDGYETVDLRAGLDFDRITLKAYLNNVFDSGGLTSASFSANVFSPAIGGSGQSYATASPIRPRTIGVTAGVSF